MIWILPGAALLVLAAAFGCYLYSFYAPPRKPLPPEVIEIPKGEIYEPFREAIENWTSEAVHDTLINLAATLEVKNATLMWPVRIAAAGKLVTPGGAVEVCHILGKEETLRRLKLGVEKLA